jgi:hypothetical protein
MKNVATMPFWLLLLRYTCLFSFRFCFSMNLSTSYQFISSQRERANALQALAQSAKADAPANP